MPEETRRRPRKGGTPRILTAAIGVLTSTTGTSTIVNGTLQGWSRAVTGDLDFEGAPVVTVRGVRFVGNAFAAIDAIGSTVTVDRSSVRGGERGFNVIFGAALTVTRSTFRDLQSAVHTGEARSVTVTRSTFTGNGAAVDCGDSICDVGHSLLADNDEAVRAFNSTVTVADNEIAGNGVGYTTSFDLDSPDDLRGNRFRGNGVGVRIFDLGKAVVRQNLFTGNDVGYQVAAEDPVEVLLDRNTFRRNGDGVLAPVAGTSLAGNSAVRNSRWGIFAPGAVDLGGNTASGNGNEPQCVGVVCT